MRLTTTQRGLGGDHQRMRKALLPLAYGTPCPFCGFIMRKGEDLDLDHQVMRMFGGTGGPRRMAHAHCNRRWGAIVGNKVRAARRKRVESRW